MGFRPSIVVVAAGRGRRFDAAMPAGGSKLEQQFGASTVLGTTLRNAVHSQLPVVLVTVASLVPAASVQLARRDIVVVADDEAARGMGHSIAAGVAERSGAPGWLILPADMPLVQPATLLAVARALEHHAVAFAQHKGRRGHPVGFSSELYSELVRLSGDEGARRIVARYPAFAVEVPDAGTLVDIDTPADLEAARAAAAQPSVTSG
ncbi:MAG: nucleotidyltransferase family protein [Betaproteobacteria bacterium]|nr:nucleotidyltransferase family protein [Betaproteobacteria bacterium]MCC6249647.1 nucleotidyltransferase family protein [Rubrivivax sp.]MCL4696295.1 nucleotidyltransferase family protein [Burkholderiaceae bacterium]